MALTDFKPHDSKGVLPNETPATQFGYRFFMDIRFFLSLLDGGIGGKFPTVEWDVELLDGGNTIFAQHVTVKLLIVYLVIGPGIGLFVWAFQSASIETRVVDGQAVSNADVFNPQTGKTTPANPSWKYTIGGQSTSEFITAEKGGGSDTAFNEGVVNDWLDSPIYNMTVPVGAVWKINTVKATGGGRVPQNLLFQFRFTLLAPGYAYLDRHGAIRSTEPHGKTVYLRHTYQGPEERIVRAQLFDVSDPTLWKAVDGRMYLMGAIGSAKSKEYRLWYSDLEGMDIKPLLYKTETLPVGSDLEGKQIALWKGKWQNVSPPAVTKSGFATCAQLGPDLFFQLSNDITVPGPIMKVGPHNNRPVFVLANEAATGRAGFILTDNVDLQYEGDGATPFVKTKGT